MEVSQVSDAEELYLKRVAQDCERVLGPEIELDALELGRNADVVLKLRYRLGRVKRTSEGRGETILAAHADLQERLVLDRIRLATSALYRSRR